MPTIQDVARLAGVAPITVSRVINNSGYFSEEARQKVRAAIAELGYVPNTLARSLRSKRTNTLALVLTDITNPFWTTVARGVEDAASNAGFSVIFCNTDESESEQEHYLDVLMQKRVDGILLVPVSGDPLPVLTAAQLRLAEFMAQQTLAPLAACLARVPAIVVSVFGLPQMTKRGLVRSLLDSTTRLSCRLADLVWCDSFSMRDYLAEAGLCDQEKLVALGHGSVGESFCQPILPSFRFPREESLQWHNAFDQDICVLP